MISSLSSQKHPLLSRLLGGVTLVLFLGWFALPSCHCQWEAIFGDSQDLEQASLLATKSPSSPDNQPVCLCDDHPTKIFEVGDAPDHPPVLSSHYFAVSLQSLRFGPSDRPGDHLTRGPPPESVPHQTEPRAYLRHRSLLL